MFGRVDLILHEIVQKKLFWKAEIERGGFIKK